MIKNIQLLRGIAAIMVILHHSVQTSNNYGYQTRFTSFFENWGASGVDIFFVISGFIMVYIDNKRQSTPISFFIQRFTRISPSYYFLTFLIAMTTALIPNAVNSIDNSFSNILYSITYTSIFINQQNPLVYVGWTIEYEMLFYILFSLSIILSKSSNLKVLFTSIFIILLIWLGINNIALNFISGMVIGLIHQNVKIHNIFMRKEGAMMFILMIGIALHISSLLVNFPDGTRSTDNRVYYFSLSSAIIILSSLYIRPIQNSIAIKIGDASYSIYLIQVLSIPATYKALDSLSVQHFLSSDLIILISTSVSILCGMIFYYIFEKPSIKIIRNLIFRKTQQVSK